MKGGECLKLTVILTSTQMEANRMMAILELAWLYGYQGPTGQGNIMSIRINCTLRSRQLFFNVTYIQLKKTAEWLHSYRVRKNEAVINVNSQAAIKASQSNVITCLLVKETVESLNTIANSMKVTIRRDNSHVDDSVAHRGIAITDTLAKKGAADMKAPRVPDLLKLILIYGTIVNHDYKTK